MCGGGGCWVVRGDSGGSYLGEGLVVFFLNNVVLVPLLLLLLLLVVANEERMPQAVSLRRKFLVQGLLEFV